jgi:16S rRNA (cytidine1402-2'-O)-methyltransferase
LSGRLYVVATPIGNLEDLSPRAARILRDAALIVAEDTRVTAKLLAHLGVHKRLLSSYRENEASRAPEIVEALLRGEEVALCTDAGSPGLSDPGEAVVAAAHAAGVPVTPIPGPSAAAAALSASGFAAAGFRFYGFLPRKGAERAQGLAEIARERVPSVLFEAPGRLGKTLADLEAACGGARKAVVARELTKIHEEVVRGSLAELRERFSGEVRGEVTLVVGPAPEEAARLVTDEEILEALRVRPEGESVRERAEAVAQALGVPRRRVYNLAVRIR